MTLASATDEEVSKVGQCSNEGPPQPKKKIQKTARRMLNSKCISLLSDPWDSGSRKKLKTWRVPEPTEYNYFRIDDRTGMTNINTAFTDFLSF